MVNQIQFLKLENEYPVKDIKVNGEPLWPYLRIYFFSKARLQVNASSSDVLQLSLWKTLGSLFYGWKNWFKSYDYLIFSASDQRKKVGEIWTERGDVVHSILPSSIIYELPNPSHKPFNKLPHSGVTSKLLFHVLEKLLSKFGFVKAKIEGKEIADEICSKLNIENTINYYAKRLVIQEKLMNSYMRWFKKPKATFFITPFTQMGYIKALKKNNVPVIEFQHGVIGKEHYAYNLEFNLDANCYPHYLLTYGADDCEILKNINSKYVATDRLIPIGNYSLETALAIPKPSGTIETQGLTTVCVTIQDIFEAQYVELIKGLAQLSKVEVHVVPRRKPKSHYSQFGFPENVIISELNVYETIRLCKIHVTINSTCALEAPFLGTHNLLLNYKNRAKVYFADRLQEGVNTNFFETVEELVDEVQNVQVPNHHTLQKSVSAMFKPGFRTNLENFINQL